jgi:hypothetical protein
VKTAGELRADADRWRENARRVTDPDLLQMIHELIKELEARARSLEDGA